MRVYNRLILARLFMLLPFIWVGIVLLIPLTWVGRAVSQFNGLDSASIWLALLWALVPTAQEALAPAWLFTATFVIFRMRSEGEAGIRSSLGGTPLKGAIPWLYASVVMVCIAALFGFFFGPSACRNVDSFMTAGLREARWSLLRERNFAPLGDSVTLYAEGVEAGGLKNLFIVDATSAAPQTLAAHQGEMTVGEGGVAFILHQGWVSRAGLGIISFEKLEASFPATETALKIFPDAYAKSGLGLPNPDESTAVDEKAPSPIREAAALKAREAQSEPWRRLALILLVPLFTVAARVCAHPRLRSPAQALGTAALWLASTYMLGRLGRNLALKEVVSPMLGAFLPLAVSALFALIPAGDDR